ncbi:MAG: glutathione S-transferase N-terminal domain-containing protein [Paracoccaceae bacterium]
MTDTLFLGDRSYSSWSMRAWLLCDVFDIPVSVQMVDFNLTSVAEQLPAMAPARTVPAMMFQDGTLVWDSLAIAEELASRHPEAGLWPADPVARARARSLSAEMHSSFAALRTDCPMNLRVAYTDVPHTPDVLADVARIDALWNWARARLAPTDGPWLCGAYTIVDAMFAPVAARLAGYDLPMSQTAREYVMSHLHHGPFRRWRAMGLAQGDTLPWYARDYPTKTWPGPEHAQAQARDAGPAVNDLCPYSQSHVKHFLEYDGQIWGMCNAFCRDKTVADPEAWPAFTKMVAAMSKA